MTTLARIREKVRRLTATPSSAQMPDSVIDDYINTFYQYDFPAIAKVDQLITNFEVALEAGVDVYDWPSNTEILMQAPAYVSGIQVQMFFDQTQFYNWFPQVDYQQEAQGSGGATQSITLINVPVARSSLFIAAVDVNGVQLNATDDGQGNIIGDVTGASNTINYTTGAVVVTFSDVIPTTNAVTISYYPYNSGIPVGVLFFNQQLKFRPIPNKPYQFVTQVQQKPTELLADGSSPTLNEWWQYLAVGAAKRILQDRLAMDQVALIEPLYQEQRQNVLSRTASQHAQTRVATIYSNTFQWPNLWGFGL